MAEHELYSQQACATFEAAMAKRTASQAAVFLLPHLRTGMHVLDAGCGPGSITLGLAAAVAPRGVVGIDVQPSQVEQARALAAQRGVTNVRFEVINIYSCHLLTELPNTRLETTEERGSAFAVKIPTDCFIIPGRISKRRFN